MAKLNSFKSRVSLFACRTSIIDLHNIMSRLSVEARLHTSLLVLYIKQLQVQGFFRVEHVAKQY